LLGKSDAPLPLATIARELGLVPSTCLYVLRALVAEELVAFEVTTKCYTLEVGILTLARGWLRRNDFPGLAQPVLDRIASTFKVAVLGVQIVGIDHIIAVAVSKTGSNFQLSTQVGSRFPALISATGRCIAAFGGHSEAALKARFHTLRWDAPPTYDSWCTQIAETSAQGYGVDEGNYITGVTVLAAPVWKSGEKLSHALVAIGIGSALQQEGLEPLAAALVTGAKSVSEQMGG
jgi:DNA-binding IclR family transcriptional regulator